MIDAPIAKRVDETADDVPREERARLSGYKRRFAIIYLGLALAAGAGLGALVIVLTDSDDTTQVVSQAWSEFHPDGSPNARANEIAAHVTSRYRGSDGQQLVGGDRRATGGRLEPAGGKHAGPDTSGRDPTGHPNGRRDREPGDRGHRHVERSAVRAVRLGRPVRHRQRTAIGGTSPPASPGRRSSLPFTRSRTSAG